MHRLGLRIFSTDAIGTWTAPCSNSQSGGVVRCRQRPAGGSVFIISVGTYLGTYSISDIKKRLR
jgi:hypothetical protein